MKKRVEKIRPMKNTWYDWLINYIPESIRKSLSGFKDKIISLFKTNAPKANQKNETKEILLYQIRPKQTKDRIIGDIWTIFGTKE